MPSRPRSLCRAVSGLLPGLVLGLALVGCGDASIDRLPPATDAGPTAQYHVHVEPLPGGMLTHQPPGPEALVPARPWAPQDVPADRLPVTPETADDPLSAFRALLRECEIYTNLAYSGDPGAPQVEQDRFADAVLIAERDDGSALIEDGRGARLVFEDWPYEARLSPESGRADDLPDSYRRTCLPERFPRE